MRDTLLHIPLYAAFSATAYLAIHITSPIMAAVLIGCFIGLIREVTQAQANHGNNFLTGWAFWIWSRQKRLETFVPAAILIAIAMIYQLAFA